MNLVSIECSFPEDNRFYVSIAYQHLSKTIEASRVHLFDIMTQYRAIFPDDDPLIMGQNSGPPLGGLFYQWVNEKVNKNMSTIIIIIWFFRFVISFKCWRKI